MRKLGFLMATSVALLASVAPAQTITVNLSGWVLNGSAANCSDIDNFNVSNPSGGGFLTGGASAFVASSPNFTTAGATVQGILNSGAPVSGRAAATTTCNESFSLTSGTGNVSVNATIFNGPFVNNVLGSGYSGFARTSVTFVSSITARASGGAQSQAGPPGTPGVLATVPLTIANSVSGQSSFTWAAQSAAQSAGTLTGIGAGIQLNSNTGVDATITLN